MGHHSFFPAVFERKTGSQYEAILGWELTGLLLAELLLSNLPVNVLNSAENFIYLTTHLYQNRNIFAHAISTWSPGLSLELHLTSLPDLEFQSRGTVSYHLLLRSVANRPEVAAELAFTHYATMQALLNSCFPEAEFTSIKEREQLADFLEPFHPGYATLLSHQRQSINLARPLTQKVSGFAASQSLSDNPGCPLIEHTYPWVAGRDSQERLIRFLLWQTYPVWITIRVRPSQHTETERERLRKVVEECDGYLSGSITSETVHTHQLKALQEQTFQRLASLKGRGLDLAVLVFTMDRPDPALISMLGNSISNPVDRPSAETLLQGGFASEVVDLNDSLNPLWFPDEVYCPGEAAMAFRLPSPPYHELPGMPVKRFRSAFAHLPTSFSGSPDTTLLGMNVHRGLRQPVHCRIEDRMRHMFIMGMTGTGKSSFMESLLLQDIEKGYGLCLVDPHGELVENLLGKIPRKREKDVILIDPMDREQLVGFNLLEWKTVDDRDQIIDNLYRSLDQMYDMRQTGGPIFESNFRSMMKLLMGNKTRQGFTPTIVEFPALYLHEDFRKWLGRTMDDPVVMDFLEELERTGGEASLQNLSPYITSKMGRFINDATLRRIVGQERTPFDFRSIMDEGRIVLFKLGKGRFGPYVSGLLASQIVSRFKNAAMSRADIPESKRRPFFLYVDEFQNLPKDEFTELLSEARKYRLGLILANQFASQLDTLGTERNTLRAILGNVGIFVIFRLGIEDAQQLSLIFHPTFSERDLKEIPNWQAYVQLRIEGRVLPPFNIETVLHRRSHNAKAAERIREHSRKKYSRPAKEVDEQILDRRKFFDKRTQPD